MVYLTPSLLARGLRAYSKNTKSLQDELEHLINELKESKEMVAQEESERCIILIEEAISHKSNFETCLNKFYAKVVVDLANHHFTINSGRENADNLPLATKSNSKQTTLSQTKYKKYIKYQKVINEYLEYKNN
jgi:hypothetical protein